MYLCDLKGINLEWSEARPWCVCDLRVRSGVIYWLRGANGVGKSTWMRSIMGFLPSGVRVSWYHDACRSMEKSPRFDTQLSIAAEPCDSVWVMVEQEYYLRTGRFPSQVRIGRLLDGIDFNVDRSTKWGGLSMGQQQQIMQLFMYYSQAAIWIVDEPFVYLDACATRRLLNQIEHHQQSGGAVILTSHIKISVAAEIINLTRI